MNCALLGCRMPAIYWSPCRAYNQAQPCDRQQSSGPRNKIIQERPATRSQAKARLLLFLEDPSSREPTILAALQRQKSGDRRRKKLAFDVLPDKGGKGVHPVFQELAATGADVAIGIEQPVFDMDESLGLAQGVHIQIGQDVAQMLLGQSRADAADRGPDHARRL